MLCNLFPFKKFDHLGARLKLLVISIFILMATSGCSYVTQSVASQTLSTQQVYDRFAPQQQVVLDSSKVFKYQFDSPRRTNVSKAREPVIAKTSNNNRVLSANEYLSANGNICKRVSRSAMAVQNIICQINGHWQKPAEIGIRY